MKTMNTKVAILLSTALFATYGCQSTSASKTQAAPKAVAAAPAAKADPSNPLTAPQLNLAKVVEEKGTSLTLEFPAVSDADKGKIWPSAQFRAQGGPWDWSDKESFIVDVTNPMDQTAHFILKVYDNQHGGQATAISHKVEVPAGQTRPVEMRLDKDAAKMGGYWGGENINLQKISMFSVYVQGPVPKQTITLDNFELLD
ncbi:hypothetical protein [Vibrio sp. WXL103]|uniref:hypothetical protein n=1 Tax=unclassified Vibrio TaxID=2614977 RepID=UPI003EC5A9DD